MGAVFLGEKSVSFCSNSFYY